MLTRSSARQRGEDSGSPAPDAELDQLFLQIANSETFQAAPVMRALLLYLWEQRGKSPSEYAIAVDGLSRPPSFDPRTDSTARVQIARLRAKLKAFYESAGGGFPLRVSIPHGRHEIEWVYDGPPVAPPLVPISEKPRHSFVVPMAISLALVSIAINGVLLFDRHQTSGAARPASLPGVWQSFLANGKPLEIVLPSPTYFYWSRPNISVRDFSVTEYPKWRDSPVLREFGERWGPPAVYPVYVGAPEMTLGLKLLQYLETRGRTVNMVESRKLAADATSSFNTVFIGMPRTASYLDPILAKANFYIASVEPDVIENRKPAPGESKEFREVIYGSNRELTPAIIMLLPKRPESTRSLLLLARRLDGLTSILLSPSGLRQINNALAQHGSPDAWEMVIEAEVQDTTVLRVWPAAVRAIADDYWR
jgi:hypothetical protein